MSESLDLGRAPSGRGNARRPRFRFGDASRRAYPPTEVESFGRILGSLPASETINLCAVSALEHFRAVQLMEFATLERVVGAVELSVAECVHVLRPELVDHHRSITAYVAALSSNKKIRQSHRASVWLRIASDPNYRPYGPSSESANLKRSFERLIDAFKVRYIAPQVEDAVSDFYGRAIATSIDLKSQFNDRRVEAPPLEFAAINRLRRSLSQHDSIAIGISAPRGSGKTTIIDTLCPRTERSGNSITIRADAPVYFEPREYYLTVLGLLCEAILTESGDFGEEELPQQLRPLPRLRRATALVASATLGLVWVAILVSLGLAGYAVLRLLPASSIDVDIQSPLVQKLALVVLGSLFLATWLVLERYRRRRYLFVTSASRQSVVLDLPLFFGAACVLSASELARVSGARIPIDVDTLGWIFFLLGALALVCLLLAVTRPLRVAVLTQRDLATQEQIEGLGIRALTELQSVRFQNTFTRADGAKIGSSSPFAAEVSTQRQVSAAQAPWTLPEIVRRTRRLLAEASYESPGVARYILIGVDEVDKIGDPLQAANLLIALKLFSEFPT